MAAHFLEKGELEGVVEAGTTLLEYHVLLGTAKDDLDRFLPVIRAGLRDMVAKLPTLQTTDALLPRGATALTGTGMLAALGYEEERAALQALRPISVPLFAEELRIAQTYAGLRPLEKDAPPSRAFEQIPPDLREHYFRAAAHRAAVLRRIPEGERSPAQAKELAFALDVVRAGWRHEDLWIRAYALGALAAIDPERGPAAIAEAIDGGGPLALFGISLAEAPVDLAKRIASCLGGLSSAEPDYAAMAAVILLDLPDGQRCLELPRQRP
jgi:hypothetical protein